MNNFLFVINSMADLADECDKRGCLEESERLTNILAFVSDIAELSKISKVVEVQEDGKKKFKVISENNPNWSGGVFLSKKEAEDRLREVEYFKTKKD